MNALGVVVLVATTATTGIGKPHTGKFWMRHHAAIEGPAPPGGPMIAGAGAGGPGCAGPGCAGGGGGAGAGGAGGAGGRKFPNTRSQVYFVDPPGMKVGW